MEAVAKDVAAAADDEVDDAGIDVAFAAMMVQVEI